MARTYSLFGAKVIKIVEWATVARGSLRWMCESTFDTKIMVGRLWSREGRDLSSQRFCGQDWLWEWARDAWGKLRWTSEWVERLFLAALGGENERKPNHGWNERMKDLRLWPRLIEWGKDVRDLPTAFGEQQVSDLLMPTAFGEHQVSICWEVPLVAKALGGRVHSKSHLLLMLGDQQCWPQLPDASLNALTKYNILILCHAKQKCLTGKNQQIVMQELPKIFDEARDSWCISSYISSPTLHAWHWERFSFISTISDVLATQHSSILVWFKICWHQYQVFEITTVSDFQLSMPASIGMAISFMTSDLKTNLTEVFGWGKVTDQLEVTHG